MVSVPTRGKESKVADVKKVAVAAQVVEGAESGEEFEYVTIPELDLFDYPHPGVGINREHYGPGTHKLPKDIAAEVKDRLRVYEAQNIRILQPRKDMRALRDLAKGGQHTRGAELDK
jgi:hypothetical protein